MFEELRRKEKMEEKYNIYMEDNDKNDDTENAVFVVEIPTKYHERADIIEAKAKEISNLEHYNVLDRRQ